MTGATAKGKKTHWKVHASKVTSSIAIALRELTSKWLGLIWLSLLALYLTLLSIENYWQAIGVMPIVGRISGAHPAFLPKPFVDDGADFAILGQIIHRPDFWVAVVFSLAIATKQANWLRAQQAGIITKSSGGREFSLSRVNKAKASSGILMLLFYAIDIWVGMVNFPFIGVASTVLPVHLMWFVLSVFGQELVGNAVLDMLEDVKNGD